MDPISMSRMGQLRQRELLESAARWNKARQQNMHESGQGVRMLRNLLALVKRLASQGAPSPDFRENEGTSPCDSQELAQVQPCREAV